MRGDHSRHSTREVESRGRRRRGGGGWEGEEDKNKKRKREKRNGRRAGTDSDQREFSDVIEYFEDIRRYDAVVIHACLFN